MRFLLILTGLVFIFSPDISLLDLLPDFIGWALIVLGLQRLADIEARAEDAKKLAKRMMLISIVKAVLSLFTFRFSSADLLLATFSYAIVEIITVFPLVTDLFKGLDYCAVRLGAALDSDKLNLAKWYLHIFFIIKNVLAVLPSTVSLFDSDITGNYSANTWFVDFDAAMRVFMVFAFFLSAVVSIVLLVHFVPFWKRLAKNRELIEKMLEHRRVTVLENPSRMIKKNTGFVISLLIPSVIFFFDYYLDGVDAFPTFIGFALLAIASVFADKRLDLHSAPLTAVSFAGFAVSLASFLYRLIPLMESGFVIDMNFSAKPLALPLAVLNALLVAAAFILIFRLAGQLNKKYVKYTLEDSLILYMAGGVITAFFSAALYAFPQLNTTFVFPSLIFGVVFSALSVNYLIKLRKQIYQDNKD